MALQKTQSIQKNVHDAESTGWLEKVRSPVLISVLLLTTTFVVYGPVARFDFVNYDDSDYVTANRHVQSGLTWSNVVWAFQTGHASNWHPLTWLSHMLDCTLFGEHAGGPHLANLFFHAANALLLFVVLREFTGAFWRSAAVAALFALHPLHVESVAWVSERKDVLSTLFFLLTIWAYGRYAAQRVSDKAGKPQGWALLAPGWGYYLLALSFFALGLMSKPMLVTMPFILLLLDFWPLCRFGWRGYTETARSTVWLLLEKLPYFFLSALSSIVTFLVQQKGGAVSTSLPFGARLANALVSYIRYLAKTVWPVNLSVLYPHPGHWPAVIVVACALLVVAVSVLVIVVSRSRPYLAMGWLWYVGSLVPVIGLVQVGIQSMADRYSYVPLIGIFIALIWGAGEAVVAGTWGVRAVSFCAVVALLSCAGLTHKQVLYWRDSEALFRHAVLVTRNNYLAYNNLGFYLSQKGRVSEAMTNYLKSIEINPAYEDALNNYGFALAGQKRFAEALNYYAAALRVRPNQPEVHNNLGNALSELGRLDEAIQQYQIVLQTQPEHADAHNNLGIALAMKGKLDEAIPHFRDAIRFKRKYASAHSNLGNALAAQHHLKEAIQEYQEALRLKPDDAQAHNNLGNVLVEEGKLEEAVQHYTEALRLNADNPEAHFNLGIVLSRQGHREPAAQHFREALQLKPDYTEARKELERLGVSR